MLPMALYMDVSRFGKRRFWRTGCGSISGLLVQDLRLLAPMESADRAVSTSLRQPGSSSDRGRVLPFLNI